MRKIIERVCYLDTVYSFSLYILWKSKDEVENTLFVFTDRMPQVILDKVSNKVVFKYVFSSNQIQYQKYRIINKLKLIKYKFAKDCEYYGNDRLTYSHFFVKKGNFTLIEDGTMNYNLDYFNSMNIRYENTSLIRQVYRRIFWALYDGVNHKFLGIDDRVKSVLLTGILPTPAIIKKKTILISFSELWGKSENIEYLLYIFNLKDIKTIIIDNLLITQPLKMEEEEKILYYRKLTSDYTKLTIKPHPRETTNYKQYFPNCIVLDSWVPLEVFKEIGFKFNRIITISSTAALSLKGNDTIIDWCEDKSITFN